MTIAKLDRSQNRQWPLVAIQEFDYADLTSATAVPAVHVPEGARVIGGGIMVDTVWNSAVSDVLDAGDGVDDDEYTSSQIDLTSAGYTALTITGYKYTTPDWIDLTWTGSGAVPTTGAGRIIVMYVVDSRENEIEPSAT